MHVMIYIERNGVFLRFVQLLSLTLLVPLLRTHSVPPTHDLPLRLTNVSDWA